MKQLVAINQMSTVIIKQQSQTLREHFDSEEELSDLMTKRMLESQMVNDVEEDLGPLAAEKLELPGMMGYAAKAKSKTIGYE